MEVKFTADLHLYDYPVIEARMPDQTADYYADYIVDKWNSAVEDTDLVIIVGDVGYPVAKSFQTIQKLRGTKILVIGNHDTLWGNKIYDNSLFIGTHASVILENAIYIKHIPDFTNEDYLHYKYLIHGHHHNYTTYTMRAKLQNYAKDTQRLNCSVDHNNYKPCTLQELIINKEVLLDNCARNKLI